MSPFWRRGPSGAERPGSSPPPRPRLPRETAFPPVGTRFPRVSPRSSEVTGKRESVPVPVPRVPQVNKYTHDGDLRGTGAGGTGLSVRRGLTRK